METGPANWQLVLCIIGYFLVALAFTEFFRRHKKCAAVFFVLALFTCPLWAPNRDSWFEWAKIISVLVPTMLLNFTRWAQSENVKGKFWDFFRMKGVMWFFYGVVFLNILEASIRDIELGFSFNAIAGFALIVTMPFADKYWRINKKKGPKHYGELDVDFARGWCFLYTTWNACFVLGAIPDEFVGGFAILLLTEFYSTVLKRPDQYMIARVYSLAFFEIQLGVSNVPKFMDASAWAAPKVVFYWGVVNAVWGIGYVLWYCWQLHKGRGDEKFRTPITDPTKA